ncbi:MAG: protease modulator HflC [Alphaproteobacteria bacterium]|nr:MAG: protease modulator HflC [Alphaproteobacteria bacterium]TAF14202.1 MAG: protease modulator HflC [Alphaproteobacteria bacterium]TAF39324.1 MAG: protease modulator HflC [Alphaproteobacteria bacterium]TAF76911.1 MAG: protease modulator HflC [Alphaproteobacteria bacterium]
MGNRFIILTILGCFAVMGALNSFFIVDQTQQALVLRFGKPVGDPIREPGLNFKMPFTDSVEFFDRRTLILNADEKAVILKDQDRLVVDAYVTYRITNPLRFYQAVRNETIMNQRLDNILETSLREALGRENLNTLLSPKRSEIMNNIRTNVSRLASGERLPNAETDKVLKDTERAGFGIEIIDVRMMRTDLPKETSTPIYNRMRSDRQKVAEKFRAQGKKESQIIQSEADKQKTIILAEAERSSTELRGQGDAEATRILGEAYGANPEFFEFYRSMQAYKKSITKDNTTLILSPDNKFLKYMQKN